MRRTQWRKMAQYVKNSRYRSAWRKFVQAMACIVVFCTTYALILPAITAEKTYFYGLEVHEHTDSCYIQEIESALVCTLEELVPHTHGEECLDADGIFVCDLEAIHIHGENCYQMQTRNVLVCEQEAHIHAEACRADPNADLENREDWESTLTQVEMTGSWAKDLTAVASSQVGYRESERNYLAEEGQPRKGYTRYGAWYGIPYGDWNAMFASFCLHYAGIPQEAIGWNSSSALWIEELRIGELTADALDKVPEAGDLLFYRESEESQIRTAIVLGQESQTDENGEHTFLRIVEGDRDDQVLQHLVNLEQITILGCCGTDLVQQRWEELHPRAETTDPTAETTEVTEATEETLPSEETPEVVRISQQMHTENYIVTVTYDNTLALPEGAELRVVEYPRDSDIFRQRCEEAGYELEWLLNIGFFLGEEELTLDGTFDVVVTSKLGEDLGRDITHFAEDGAERITAADASDSAPEGQTAVSFSAEGFSDFGGGVALPAEPDFGISTFAVGDVREADSYTFVTANPANLLEGVDYAIYVANGQHYYFLGSTLTSVDALNTGYYTSPTTIGYNWTLDSGKMGTKWASDFTWRVIKSGNQYYLESQKNGNRLQLGNSMSLTANGSLLTNSVNGARTTITSGNYRLRNSNGWYSTRWESATSVYFAAVTPAYRNYPDAVYTGDIHVDRLRFYNICESADNGITALAGCEFLIEGTRSDGQPYSTTIISDNNPQIALPSDIPDGVYTIREVSAPEGNMRDLNHTREFWISDGALVSEHNIGTFINHKLDRLTVGKTGEVEDYNNRIYQILLNAKTNLRMYRMDPIEVLFLVDKSNSMLFPSGLNDTGKSITLRIDNPNDQNDNDNNLNNIWNNRNVLNSLDKNQVYYIIADPHGTSTVYAVWYDGTTWMYQDASYYAKAKFNNGPGYESSGELVIFPSNKSYSRQAAEEDVGDINYRSNGGGLDYSSSGSSLGNYIDSASNDSRTFRLYTAKDSYNRLHYLEEALANMIYELADANPDNQVVLVPFTKEEQRTIYPVGSNTPVAQPVKLTTSNAEMLYDIVTHIETSGGTRQDRALEYAYEEYLMNADEFDVRHTYTVLITDGAPVRSGSDASPLGNINSGATTADNGEIYGRIKGWGAKVKEESTLMSVALGMGEVDGGREVLKQIATNEYFYCALDDASALTENMQRILFDSMQDIGELLVDNGTVVDEISDSFYPIAWTEPEQADSAGRTLLNQSNGKAWLLMQTGDWITLDGKFTTAGAPDAAGQLQQKEDGTYYIRWQNQTVSGRGWNGTFYVKAKEDFIGGNAIDTNKDAYVSVNDATKNMDTPTVNVHLLDMNENSSEVTVYLGDIINSENSSPRGVLRAFYNQICFGKILEESQLTDPAMVNRLDPDGNSQDGLERNLFYLKYALGYEAEDGTWVPRELTTDEWTALESGGSLTIPYVYDTASSHGNVGYFTIRLDKTSDSYRQHEATEACQPGGSPLTENCRNPAETYTLTVTYTAYEPGEQGRPTANVNNGSGSPGTVVRKGAQGLNNGQGIVTSENIHEVHVISGKILVEKTFTQGTEWTAGDTFTFQLTPESGSAVSQTVTIGADGTASAVFDQLSRGTYTVTEAVDEDYAVKSVTVGQATNAYYTQPDPMQVKFTMGNNLENENVIGKASESDVFTSYIDPVNGVYGEASFANAPQIYTDEVPVKKIWDNGEANHTADCVYLVLYLDDQPVLDTEGNARLLRLNAESGWEGVFTVVLADKNDSADNYNYSVREVRNISPDELFGWQKAILENDGESILYYDVALTDGGLIGVNGKGYIVEYAVSEEGVHQVTNYESFVLPETGGMGTHMYTFSGLAMVMAALLYGYSLRRKRERGASG